MKGLISFRLVALLAAMMCALGASAAEAYACYTWDYNVLSFYYDDMRAYRMGRTYDLNTGENYPGWGIDGTCANVTRVVFDTSFADYRPTTTYMWFSDMANLQTILGISNLNTSEVTDMGNMFRGCTGLTSLDVSNFNTSKVNVMMYMFYGCTNLRTIYGGDAWNTDAVTGSLNMFLDCYSLVGGQGTTYNSANGITYTHIDGGPSNPGYFTAVGTEAYACYTPSNTTLTFYYDTQRSSRPGTTYDLNTGGGDPGWYTDNTEVNVTKVVFHPFFAGARPSSTFRWFHNMQKLQSITGLSYLKTDEVTNMSYMFNRCSTLTSLDVSQFNTAKVINMEGMFDGCSGLTSLDLSSFNTSSLTSTAYMFAACSNLRTIYVGEGWSTAAVTGSVSMFSDCTSLVGGLGTTYNANHIDKTYAHIDGGPINPGYFSDKNAIEAYACYTWDFNVLAFYYDDMRALRMGRTYDLSTGENYPGWYTDGTYANVTRVIFDTSFANARPTTTYGWFSGMTNLQTILGISNLNTSEVTDMGNMFRLCTGLTSLDLSNFNTSKVTNMAEMFRFCSSLQTINVSSGWSTAAVTSSTRMFGNCTSLVGGKGTTYDANHVDKAYAHIDGGTSNPGYFTAGTEAYACYTPGNTTLTFYHDNQRYSRPGSTYDLNTGANNPSWYTDGTYANVTRVVFDPSFAGARPTTTYYWFYEMQNLQTITGLSYLNTSEVNRMSYMFYGCNKFTSLDLSSFNTSKVTIMWAMFNNCTGLTSLDLSSFNTSQVTSMGYMFRNCGSLRTIYAGEDWSTAAVTQSTYMFEGCPSLVGGQGTTYDASHINKAYAHIDGGPSNPGYFTAAGTQAYSCYTPDNTTLTFYYDTERSSRPGTTYNLNTGENDPGWKTDGTNANVTQVVFDPSFAGARPTTTYLWFYLMRNLQTIEGIEYLNTSEVTNMAHMFNSCSKLTSLDLSSFNTSKVTEMRVMFYNCSGLTSLDLSSFNTANVTSMFNMFGSSGSLRTIYAGDDWSTAAVTNSSLMFTNCASLVGGQGTTYDASHIDKAYAHIDGGPSNPGYFTDKNAGMRGDVNGDGSVSIGDVTALIDYLLSGDDSGINLNAADCNLDTGVSISDVTALIDYLLSGQW